jgi:uncharacterized membrane protein YphA (DoxX/SURF4 family)
MSIGLTSAPGRMYRYLLRGTQLIVGVVFILAGFSKATDTTALAKVLVFDGLEPVASPLLWIIPLWEILLGAGLIMELQPRILMWLAAGTLVGFTVQLTVLLLGSNAPDCGCLLLLRQHASTQSLHAMGISRNLVLLTGLLCSLFTLRSSYARG